MKSTTKAGISCFSLSNFFNQSNKIFDHRPNLKDFKP